jgi:HAD superfamily hydrolase (TIGR01509 family)
VEAVLLDMGGVLIPEVPDYSGATRNPTLRDPLRRWGVEDVDGLVLEAGRRIREAYRTLESRCEQPDPDLVLADLPSTIRDVLIRAFADEAAQIPYAHARDVVARLAHRYRLGLVSNTVIPGDHHARRLALYGILPHISSARWSANFGRRKPDPAMVQAVLADLQVSPDRAVFVGDKIRTDVEAAHRAGVHSVWLRRNSSVPSDGLRPDFVIQDLRELPILLRRLTGTKRGRG